MWWLTTLGALAGALAGLGVPWRAPRRRCRRPAAGQADLARLAADLARLAREIDRVEQGHQPGKMTRLRATVAAYDDTLLCCCRTLGVRPPRERAPLAAGERLDTEVALLQHGVTW